MSPYEKGIVVVEGMQEQTKLEELRMQIQEEGENSAGLVPRQERESGLGVGKASSEGFKALSEDKTLGKREEKRSNQFVSLMSPFEKADVVVEGMHVVPQYHGTYVGVISGPFSGIQVSVTFALDAPSFNGPN